MRRAAGLLLALLCLALPARAQDAATLVADSVEIRADSTLIAEGAVEVFYQGTRLRAQRIVYDRTGERLTIDGPITITEPGGTILLADQAMLADDLEEGILRGARLVLDRELQLAAAEIVRAEGRYTGLSRVVTSACEVCPGNPVPLWEIRARRVLHDANERQLYFEGAQFRVAGVPVAYIPRLRLPDPTLERATGFLTPRFRSTSKLGFGAKLPYFITLGESRDLTLIPYLSGGTRTLEARYREAFSFGSVEVQGAISRDDILKGETRHYLFADGTFGLPRDFRLDVALRDVSDPGYLLDYGYSDADRLDSVLALSRVQRDTLFGARVIVSETLRDEERPVRDTLPSRAAEAEWERRFRLPAGTVTLGLDASALRRRSDAPGDGRDVARLGASAFWRGDRVFGPGVVGAATFGARLDSYRISDDPAFEDLTRRTPYAAAELRWPLVRAGAGATDVLEPVVQLAFADAHGGPVPNEDSRLVEFDEGNLFALDRNPGRDRVEEGLRANLGLFWTRFGPDGREHMVGLGRVFRLDEADFAPGTGLAGRQSAWLATGRLALGDRASLAGRALFDEGLVRSEIALDWQVEVASIEASYLYLVGEPEEERPDDLQELSFDAAWRIDGNWSGQLEGRFDLDEGRPARAGLGLTWANECVSVDLSLSRRFTTSSTVDADTGFGVQVSLVGFGADEARGRSRACRR